MSIIIHSLEELEVLHFLSSSSSSILDLQPDVTSRPIVGPALRVGGHMLKWEGPPSEGEGHTAKEGEREWNPSRQPLDIRVLFEAGVGEKATSHLLMENCGTAAVYYSWQVGDSPCTTLER